MTTVAGAQTALYTSPLDKNKISKITNHWEWITHSVSYKENVYVSDAADVTKEYGPIRDLVALLPEGTEWYAHLKTRQWEVNGEDTDVTQAHLMVNRGDITVEIGYAKPTNRWRNLYMTVSDARFNDTRLNGGNRVEFTPSSAKWALTAPVDVVLAKVTKHTRPAVVATAQERLESAEKELAVLTAEAEYLRTLINGYGAA